MKMQGSKQRIPRGQQLSIKPGKGPFWARVLTALGIHPRNQCCPTVKIWMESVKYWGWGEKSQMSTSTVKVQEGELELDCWNQTQLPSAFIWSSIGQDDALDSTSSPSMLPFRQTTVCSLWTMRAWKDITDSSQTRKRLNMCSTWFRLSLNTFTALWVPSKCALSLLWISSFGSRVKWKYYW